MLQFDTIDGRIKVMPNTEAKLYILENSIRQLNKAFNILFFLITTDERGETLYKSLRKVEEMVKDLNDEHLINLYDKLFEGFLTGVPHQQIRPDDYFGFLQRLGTLVNESSVQANKAEIALREAIGLQSVVGIWGGRGWHPSG
jgi:hypothetical protein